MRVKVHGEKSTLEWLRKEKRKNIWLFTREYFLKINGKGEQ